MQLTYLGNQDIYIYLSKSSDIPFTYPTESLKDTKMQLILFYISVQTYKPTVSELGLQLTLFVLSSAVIQPIPLVHWSTDTLSIMTNHLAPLAKCTINIIRLRVRIVVFNSTFNNISAIPQIYNLVRTTRFWNNLHHVI